MLKLSTWVKSFIFNRFIAKVNQKRSNRANQDRKDFFFKNIKVENSSEKVDWLYDSSAHINSILKVKKFSFLHVKNDKVILELENLRFYVENSSEWLILKEVFVDGIYNFYTSSKCVVIDIGMNVGIASLFFATKNNVENVYSFEPVGETFNQAKENLKLNIDKLSSKIETFNFGLASENKLQKFKYNPMNKGSFGYVGNQKFSSNEFQFKEVELRNVEEAIAELPIPITIKIVMKIDCEGAEYEILPLIMNLEKLPSLLMVEWHLSRENELIELLILHSYNVICQKTGPTAGLIYAYLQPIIK